MNFFQAVGSCFKKYASFSGRACRSEYYYFFLFQTIADFIADTLDETVLQGHDFAYTVGNKVEHLGILGTVLTLVLFLPGFAVSFRRLHDVNRSAWWLLIAFTIIGALFPLFYWYCCRGTAGDNRFGSDPLAAKQ
jgi:uncharacterized membrane protein YhaH (DUF805 family)